MSEKQLQVLVTIIDVKGSAPREAGASMIIKPDGKQTGTVGGGALEWQATRHARFLLDGQTGPFRQEKEIILGPDLEQCCGGVVRLSYELMAKGENGHLTASRLNGSAGQKLVLFGAGHVGKAIVKALAELEFDVDWIDNRAQMFPAQIPNNVQARLVSEPASVAEEIIDDTFVLIMTHCHKLDYDIARTALQSPHTNFVGLIGSATKKARFVKRFAADGLAIDRISRLVCPIGVAGIHSKKPAAIAASVVAQLLGESELMKTGKNTVLLRQNRA